VGPGDRQGRAGPARAPWRGDSPGLQPGRPAPGLGVGRRDGPALGGRQRRGAVDAARPRRRPDRRGLPPRRHQAGHFVLGQHRPAVAVGGAPRARRTRRSAYCCGTTRSGGRRCCGSAGSPWPSTWSGC
jgi:hypothetical protein